MKTWIQCSGYFSETARITRHWLAIEKAAVTAITDRPPPSGETVLFADREVYLCPLLSDTHVHFYMDPWPLEPALRAKPGSGDFETEVRNGIARVKAAHRRGFGFLRDLGDPHGINLEVKRRLLAGTESAPELQVAGPAIHRPKKYGRFLGVCRESLNDVLRFIDELVERDGVDFIKVVTTGIVDFATKQVKQAPQYTAEELRTVVAHAGKLGRKVASHCSGNNGVDINIAGGVPFIEHAYFADERQIERLAETGQFWTPTFAPVYQQGANESCGWDFNTRKAIDEILEEHGRRLAQGHAAGVRILAGSDAGSPGVEIGDGLLIELENMTRNLRPEEVLRIATAANADACDTHHYTGRIAVGGPASFIVCEKAPWRDIGILRQSSAVFVDGASVNREETCIPSN